MTADTNDLIDQGRVPAPVKAGGIALAAAAVLVTLVGLQSLLVISWAGLQFILPLLLVPTGIASGLVAASLVKGRAWTHKASLAAAIALTVLAFTFFVFSLLAGLVSLLALLSLGAAATAIVMVSLALGPMKKVVEIRKQLRQQGYDLDF